eukprot:TRINITY_DN315_c0_g1_i1.p1 TRINITY_DN315_c0_g1~~TRINITY_DN315_c0_g1_i1.p1  ORF type:complete len:1822 (+),score=377.48 TRINITY_DN315_c0_g1_i1:110-5467(+)
MNSFRLNISNIEGNGNIFLVSVDYSDEKNSFVNSSYVSNFAIVPKQYSETITLQIANKDAIILVFQHCFKITSLIGRRWEIFETFQKIIPSNDVFEYDFFLDKEQEEKEPEECVFIMFVDQLQKKTVQKETLMNSAEVLVSPVEMIIEINNISNDNNLHDIDDSKLTFRIKHDISSANLSVFACFCLSSDDLIENRSNFLLPWILDTSKCKKFFLMKTNETLIVNEFPIVPFLWKASSENKLIISHLKLNEDNMVIPVFSEGIGNNLSILLCDETVSNDMAYSFKTPYSIPFAIDLDYRMSIESNDEKKILITTINKTKGFSYLFYDEDGEEEKLDPFWNVNENFVKFSNDHGFPSLLRLNEFPNVSNFFSTNVQNFATTIYLPSNFLSENSISMENASLYFSITVEDEGCVSMFNNDDVLVENICGIKNFNTTNVFTLRNYHDDTAYIKVFNCVSMFTQANMTWDALDMIQRTGEVDYLPKVYTIQVKPNYTNRVATKQFLVAKIPKKDVNTEIFNLEVFFPYYRWDTQNLKLMISSRDSHKINFNVTVIEKGATHHHVTTAVDFIVDAVLPCIIQVQFKKDSFTNQEGLSRHSILLEDDYKLVSFNFFNQIFQVNSYLCNITKPFSLKYSTEDSGTTLYRRKVILYSTCPIGLVEIADVVRSFLGLIGESHGVGIYVFQFDSFKEHIYSIDVDNSHSKECYEAQIEYDPKEVTEAYDIYSLNDDNFDFMINENYLFFKEMEKEFIIEMYDLFSMHEGYEICVSDDEYCLDLVVTFLTYENDELSFNGQQGKIFDDGVIIPFEQNWLKIIGKAKRLFFSNSERVNTKWVIDPYVSTIITNSYDALIFEALEKIRNVLIDYDFTEETVLSFSQNNRLGISIGSIFIIRETPTKDYIMQHHTLNSVDTKEIFDFQLAIRLKAGKYRVILSNFLYFSDFKMIVRKYPFNSCDVAATTKRVNANCAFNVFYDNVCIYDEKIDAERELLTEEYVFAEKLDHIKLNKDMIQTISLKDPHKKIDLTFSVSINEVDSRNSLCDPKIIFRNGNELNINITQLVKNSSVQEKSFRFVLTVRNGENNFKMTFPKNSCVQSVHKAHNRNFMNLNFHKHLMLEPIETPTFQYLSFTMVCYDDESLVTNINCFNELSLLQLLFSNIDSIVVLYDFSYGEDSFEPFRLENYDYYLFSIPSFEKGHHLHVAPEEYVNFNLLMFNSSSVMHDVTHKGIFNLVAKENYEGEIKMFVRIEAGKKIHVAYLPLDSSVSTEQLSIINVGDPNIDGNNILLPAFDLEIKGDNVIHRFEYRLPEFLTELCEIHLHNKMDGSSVLLSPSIMTNTFFTFEKFEYSLSSSPINSLIEGYGFWYFERFPTPIKINDHNVSISINDSDFMELTSPSASITFNFNVSFKLYAIVMMNFTQLDIVNDHISANFKNDNRLSVFFIFPQIDLFGNWILSGVIQKQSDENCSLFLDDQYANIEQYLFDEVLFVSTKIENIGLTFIHFPVFGYLIYLNLRITIFINPNTVTLDSSFFDSKLSAMNMFYGNVLEKTSVDHFHMSFCDQNFMYPHTSANSKSHLNNNTVGPLESYYPDTTNTIFVSFVEKRSYFVQISIRKSDSFDSNEFKSLETTIYFHDKELTTIESIYEKESQIKSSYSLRFYFPAEANIKNVKFYAKDKDKSFSVFVQPIFDKLFVAFENYYIFKSSIGNYYLNACNFEIQSEICGNNVSPIETGISNMQKFGIILSVVIVITVVIIFVLFLRNKELFDPLEKHFELLQIDNNDEETKIHNNNVFL